MRTETSYDALSGAIRVAVIRDDGLEIAALQVHREGWNDQAESYAVETSYPERPEGPMAVTERRHSWLPLPEELPRAD